MFENLLKNQAKDEFMGKAKLDELASWDGKTLLELAAARKVVNIKKAVVQFKNGDEAEYLKVETPKCHYLIGFSTGYNFDNLNDENTIATCKFYVTTTRDKNNPENVEGKYETYTGAKTISFGNPQRVNIVSESAILEPEAVAVKS